MHDREADARRSLEKVRRPEEIDQELFEIREAIIYENTYTKGSYKQLFVNKSYRNRLILAVIINAGQQFTGVGTLTSYSGIIYKQVFSSTNTVILINALNSVTSIMFCFITFFVADRWGRKPLLMYGALGQGCMMLGVATLVTQSKVVDGMRSIGIGAGTAVFFSSSIFSISLVGELPSIFGLRKFSQWHVEYIDTRLIPSDSSKWCCNGYADARN